MQAHHSAIIGFALVMLASLILAVVSGWFYLFYGLVLGGVVFSFVYMISVSRFDGRPSDEEDERDRRRNDGWRLG